MSKICLKCGYQRISTDSAPEYECPSCGAIYAKVEAKLGRTTLLTDEEKIKAIKQKVANPIGESNTHSIRKGSLTFAIKAMFFCLIAVFFFFLFGFFLFLDNTIMGIVFVIPALSTSKIAFKYFTFYRNPYLASDFQPSKLDNLISASLKVTGGIVGFFLCLGAAIHFGSKSTSNDTNSSNRPSIDTCLQVARSAGQYEVDLSPMLTGYWRDPSDYTSRSSFNMKGDYTNGFGAKSTKEIRCLFDTNKQLIEVSINGNSVYAIK